jgi:diaminohydroxyphosphoribosylaminopyrimidine deaminase/5-amino-6-(5-phosphoribosylamino)uracil reductase
MGSMPFSDSDLTQMRHALEIARKGIGYVSPNPLVGCVITGRNGVIIGEGSHLLFGGPHAEPNAVADAEAKGHSVEGATVYVTLEPHCHKGKTPPCTKLLIEKKIARCIIAMEDPNPKVSGEGIREMREAGIEVDVGLCKEESRELNRFFLKHITTGLPYITLKLASSLDGRSALANGQSRWITSEVSRTLVHQLRAEHDAVLVGARTAKLDDPALTVRLVEGRQPWRVVLDVALDLSESLQLFSDIHRSKTMVATSQKGVERDPRKLDELRKLGVEILPVSSKEDRIDLQALFSVLGQRGIASVLIEAGPILAGSIIKDQLFDELQLFVAPLILGADARPAVGTLDIQELSSVAKYHLHSMGRVEGSDDMLVRIRPRLRD